MSNFFRSLTSIVCSNKNFTNKPLFRLYSTFGNKFGSPGILLFCKNYRLHHHSHVHINIMQTQRILRQCPSVLGCHSSIVKFSMYSPICWNDGKNEIKHIRHPYLLNFDTCDNYQKRIYRSQSTLKSNLQISSINSTDHLASGTIGEKLVRSLPSHLVPYAQLMRVDKQTGTMLLLLPCWWGIALSTNAGSLPSLATLSIFASGAFLMRSSGCIINDIWDRKFDANVERTKNRPIAAKQISVPEAVLLLQGLLGCSLLILLQFDLNSIYLGASSLLLVSTYPAFKRFTYWPQLVLGMTFNWGVLLGWSVNSGGVVDLAAALPLYAAGVCWTLVYDTIYAHQDKKDDIQLGLKSTALKFGDRTQTYLYTFATLMTASLAASGVASEQTWPYYLSIGACAINMARITNNLNINSVESCANAFKQNTQIGWILLAGIVLGTLLKLDKPNPVNETSHVTVQGTLCSNECENSCS